MKIFTKKISAAKALYNAEMVLTICIALQNTVAAQAIYSNGNLYISGNMGILNGYNFINDVNANYLNNGNLYTYGDFTNNQSAAMVASVAGSAAGTIWFQGAANQRLNGTQDFNFYQMQLNKTAQTNLLNMSRNVSTVNNLTLTKGIGVINNYLFTWGNTGTLSQPGAGLGETGTGNYYDSYIATCDSTGTPVNGGASATVPFTGNVGIKIKNVANTATYFPVGVSYLMSYAGGTQSGGSGPNISYPTPNRVMIQNTLGIPSDYTIMINTGDIDYTPQARVSRVWYINSSDTAAVDHHDNMQLFFTERNTNDWSTIENEVENVPMPFDYTQALFVEKDYVATNTNFIAIGTNSVRSVVGSMNQEVYAQYRVGIDADVAGNKYGIYQFNRFSITNPGGIILPVTVINFNAYQEGSGVETVWTSLDEINMNHYEVQHSADATNFTTIGSVMALDNGQPSNNYSYLDTHPVSGNNYYRIKIFGNNGTINYTNIKVVTIGDGPGGVSIYPNPVTNHIFNLQLTNIPAGTYTLQVFNTLGQRIISESIEHLGGSSSQSVVLPAGTAKGEYHVQLLGTNLKVNKTLTVE